MWPPNEQFFGHRAEVDRWSVTEAITGHPVLRYYRATLDGRPMQVHDVPARPFADHRILGAWLEIGSSWGTPVAASRCPCTSGTTTTGRSSWAGWIRSGPGELELIGVLQRLLVGIDRQVTALRGAAHPAHAWAVAESARLTVRELTVLELVASGPHGRGGRPQPRHLTEHGAQAPGERLHQARRARPAQRRAAGPAAGPAAATPRATRLIIRTRRTAPRRDPGPDAARATPRAAAGCPR